VKPRRDISGAELGERLDLIDRRLESAGVTTRPEVAAKILALVSDENAGVADFGKVIRTDSNLTAKLLRMANSAYFAQRREVTNVDRACVLLGRERLKAVALGFYISKAAADSPGEALSRRVWTAGVFRACLAAELARAIDPSLASEAFVVGLMADTGVPLMHKLLGAQYDEILREARSPAHLHALEFEHLPYTHTDVSAVLARRWKLPELLARPVEWHHIEPAAPPRHEPVYRLQRLAFLVGAIDTSDPDAIPNQRAAQYEAHDLLGLKPEAFRRSLRHAGEEYQATRGLFDDVADAVSNVDMLLGRVHEQMAAALESAVVAHMRTEQETGPARFRLGGVDIEIEALADGLAAAYLSASNGKRLAAHHFVVGQESISGLREALALDVMPDDESDALQEHLARLAA
jgi:HD-like signal output (HDOD) protein